MRCESCGEYWYNFNRLDVHYALVREVRHLRVDHGFSRRKVARLVNVREKFVRDHVDNATGETDA